MPTSTPPRRSWFAVWRWKWWVWMMIAVMLLAGFVLSPPITVQLAMRGIVSHKVGNAAKAIQFPLLVAADHFWPLSDLFQAESDAIDKLLGETRYSLMWVGGTVHVSS